jgi:hypothetical protein
MSNRRQTAFAAAVAAVALAAGIAVTIGAATADRPAVPTPGSVVVVPDALETPRMPEDDPEPPPPPVTSPPPWPFGPGCPNCFG